MIAKLSKNRYLTAEERLRAGVDVRGADECWPWLGKKNKRGHGALHANGKLSEGAHRLAWEIGNARRVPEGLWVLHRCDNPPCCNPAHLFLGTAQDNNADMDAKGRRRAARGADCGSALLTPAQALAIWRSDGRAGEIGARYGVSAGAVKSIRQGRSWQHITGGPATYQRPRPRSVNTTTAEKVAEIVRLGATGVSLGFIARATGISRPTVTKYLARGAA